MMNVNEKKFTSVESYINHLIEIKKLAPEEVTFQRDVNNKNKITGIMVNARLCIDAAKMENDLNYNILVARSVIFNGSCISDYSKLPTTINGISGDIPTAKNIEQFIGQNAFGRYRNENGKLIIEGDLSIPKIEDMDLSRLIVNGNILWYGGSIDYKHLPTAYNQFLGMNKDKIKFPTKNKIPYEDLKAKGITLPKPQNKLSKFISKIYNIM